MQKKILWVCYLIFLIINISHAQNKKLIPVRGRVNVQTDSAKANQIINGKWVAVGSKKPYAIQYDYSLPFNGRPSYRLELKEQDNTLPGYAEGETKGRAELCYAYAIHSDFKRFESYMYEDAQKMKTVYLYGKGICSQGASCSYTFSVYIPSSLANNVSTIFAQWHGTPDRTLVSTPDGRVEQLSASEFIHLYNKMIFKENKGYDKIEKLDKNGRPFRDEKGDIIYKAGKANGWIVEQGGYPPLAFGFSRGYFYIKANSDRKWLTDKSDRCNADPATTPVLKPVTSEYKASTIAYKTPFIDFPKNCWVTFNLKVDWTAYGKETEKILKPGRLDVVMHYSKNGNLVTRHIVNDESMLLGRNDNTGYYFKFGIYRVGNSTVPVCYNLAGFKEEIK